eukprot:CAMPEP_0202441810 /NCGR_PEP_ID=MMETSP1360-20130828/1319_1 /ASSEMBLY_ACC=CAM_ASM_000848 /TAXON_ID=515479 /ORGANISM="Licmophora paradoxa, Strain CCMP2313" /LENGTH=343 /DNA_ID=CAMNT_0049056963 /DNA_START=279 /DNA_END=1310 /DNA_ORIENTATION=-
MEAKLDDFEQKGRAESRSNACDAFSRQPNGKIPWPLLVFRCVLGDATCKTKVMAISPVDQRKVKLATMWNGNDAGALFDAILAAAESAVEFVQQLSHEKCTPSFCNVKGNVAIQKKRDNQQVVYKSFYKTERRYPNLELVQTVDPDANLHKLGAEHGSFLEMKHLGDILCGRKEAKSQRFADIVEALQTLHGSGYVHGDIRLSNMILGADKGKLIDFDLSGKENERTYPLKFANVQDTIRHPEIVAAMKANNVDALYLKKKHDWFSLRAVMKMFRPKDAKHNQNWEGFIDGIYQESGSGETSGAEKKAVQDYDLVLGGLCNDGEDQVAKSFDADGTGSPAKPE